MNKWIGVGLPGIGAEILAFAGTTMFATTLCVPYMVASVISQIALNIMECCSNTIFTIGLLGAIECAAAHLGCEVGTSNAEDLLCHDVVDALLQVGCLLFEACQ